ncbi:hypothetical protein KKC59_04880, partial [bacterium]|nr:hypothetical protein [bacterium]
EEYIFDLNQRLEVYRKIAGAGSEKEIKEVLNEIKDRFGKKIPKEIALLIEISKIKIVAGMKGINYIGRRGEFLDVIGEKGHDIIKLSEAEQEDGELLINKIWSNYI